MVRIATNIKSFLKHLFGVYFAIPDPVAGGLLIVDYAKRLQGTKLAQKIKAQNKSHRTVA